MTYSAMFESMASRLPLFMLLATLGSTLESVAAEHGSNIDLRIVVDVSDSMLDRDPDNLRASGIELLIRTLPDGAHAGIWSYARHVRKVARYAPVDALWRQIASIHVASLKTGEVLADLPGALHAATWDLQQKDRDAVHIVLFSNGDIRANDGADVDARQRQALLSTWATELRRARVHVHTIGFLAEEVAKDAASDDTALLRQLADLSGGVHRVVADQSQLQTALMDIQHLVAMQPQAQLDPAGRFQIAPGAERFTILWFNNDASVTTPKLRTPDDLTIDRLSSLPDGRWLLAKNFEMVTINQPQPGWWQVQGATPDSLSVIGEIDIRVKGISRTVVPSDDSSVEIELFSRGTLINHADFLQLLDVRVWVVTDGEHRPLPVDQTDTGFVAYFVNLEDGAHDLQVKVVAPTFSRAVTVPFVVSNPLLVELMQAADEDAIAWVQFSHSQVDYATVRTAGIVRKPPQIASLIPGERLPAGLWRVPLGHREGIVEVAFSALGNYLNGKGVSLKTKPHAISLPLAVGETMTLRFDAQGKLINRPEDKPQVAAAVVVAQPEVSSASATPPPDGTTTADELPPPGETPGLPLIPLWFVGLISVLNLAIGGVIWWLLKPAPTPLVMV